MFQTHLDNFGGDFGHIWIFEKFSTFFQNLEVSSLHGTLVKIFFFEKSPQNTFKTRLDTFGNDLGQIRNIENSWFIFEKFRRLDPPWKTGQKFFEKIAPKHFQNSFEYFWEQFWAFLEF